MLKNKLRYVVLFFLLTLLPGQLQAQEPVVQAILFYSPTCPHCHDVIENVLPPLKAQYGDQLQLVGVDTTKASGGQLFETAYHLYADPETSKGVPALLVGSTYLVGASEIPERFPGIIEEGLRAGGIPWPDLPGLHEAIPNLPKAAGGAQTAVSSTPISAKSDTAVFDDALANELAAPVESPSGMFLAWLVMGGMLFALAYVFWLVFRSRGRSVASLLQSHNLIGWLIPILALAGLAVALYLAFVEVTQSAAVCGPIGDCNAVQSSPYANLLGIPIAVLGALNYVGILILWGILRLAAPRPVPWAGAGLFLLTLVGTLFSVYLTALEIFVIDAVCAWCLSSAVITTALLVVIADAMLPNSGPRPRTANQAA